jgi:hypothetical protein
VSDRGSGVRLQRCSRESIRAAISAHRPVSVVSSASASTRLSSPLIVQHCDRPARGANELAPQLLIGEIAYV